MVQKISMKDYERLCNTKSSYSKSTFNEKLEEITGIEARPYTSYSYYAEADKYLGDSGNITVKELLDKANIQIE